jgi:hypothetical protein
MKFMSDPADVFITKIGAKPLMKHNNKDFVFVEFMDIVVPGVLNRTRH